MEEGQSFAIQQNLVTADENELKRLQQVQNLMKERLKTYWF